MSNPESQSHSQLTRLQDLPKHLIPRFVKNLPAFHESGDFRLQVEGILGEVDQKGLKVQDEDAFFSQIYQRAGLKKVPLEVMKDRMRSAVSTTLAEEGKNVEDGYEKYEILSKFNEPYRSAIYGEVKKDILKQRVSKTSSQYKEIADLDQIKKQEYQNFEKEISQKVSSWATQEPAPFSEKHQRREAERQLLDFYMSDLTDGIIRECVFRGVFNPENQRADQLSWQILAEIFDFISQADANILRESPEENNFKLGKVLMHERYHPQDLEFFQQLDRHIQAQYDFPTDKHSTTKVGEMLTRAGYDAEQTPKFISEMWKDTPQRKNNVSSLPQGIKTEMEEYLSVIDQTEEAKMRRDVLKELFKGLFNNGYIKYVERSSLLEFIKIALHILFDPNYNSVISIGYGGTESALNARVPAYVVSAAKMLENLSGVKDTLEQNTGGKCTISLPALRLFSAHHAGVKANGMSKTLAERNAQDILQMTESYLTKFHPGLNTQVSLEHDHPELYQTRAMGILERNIAETDLTALKKMGSNHGGETGYQNARFYAALHPLVMGDVVFKNGQLDQPYELLKLLNQADGVINIGGEPEIEFNHVRKEIREALLRSISEKDVNFPDMVRLISHAGSHPVYYTHPDGELTVPQLSELKSHGRSLEDLIPLKSRGNRDQKQELPGDVLADMEIIIRDITESLVKSLAESIDEWSKNIDPETYNQRWKRNFLADPCTIKNWLAIVLSKQLDHKLKSGSLDKGQFVESAKNGQILVDFPPELEFSRSHIHEIALILQQDKVTKIERGDRCLSEEFPSKQINKLDSTAVFHGIKLAAIRKYEQFLLAFYAKMRPQPQSMSLEEQDIGARIAKDRAEFAKVLDINVSSEIASPTSPKTPHSDINISYN